MKNIRYISDAPVVAISNYKEAALWCDEVILMLFPLEMSINELDLALSEFGEASKFLGFDLGERIEMAYGYHFRNRDRFDIFVSKPPNEYYVLDGEDRESAKKRGVCAQNIVRGPFLGFSDKDLDFFGESTGTVDVERVDIILSKLNLVDSSSIPWEAIIEIRKDTESKKQLNCLRRFMISDMQGYSISHIEDELGEAITQHQEAAKKWGFALASAELTVGSSINMAFGIGTAVAGLVTGSELYVAASIGAVLPLGHSLVQINHGRRNILNGSRVSYLVNLNQHAS